MPGYQFTEDVAKIGGEREITAVIELLFLKAWPVAIHLAAADVAARLR